jgi:hypothetical protein
MIIQATRSTREWAIMHGYKAFPGSQAACWRKLQPVLARTYSLTGNWLDTLAYWRSTPSREGAFQSESSSLSVGNVSSLSNPQHQFELQPPKPEKKKLCANVPCLLVFLETRIRDQRQQQFPNSIQHAKNLLMKLKKQVLRITNY